MIDAHVKLEPVVGLLVIGRYHARVIYQNIEPLKS